jgi:MFS family permease
MWYKRSEQSLRVAVFFSAATVAGAFGGLLAYLIEKLDGRAGLHGWAWIVSWSYYRRVQCLPCYRWVQFLIEGMLTIVVAAIGYWYMHDVSAILSDRLICG